MKVILLSIDVHKFNLFAQQQSNSETKNFLIGYYKNIKNELPNDTWSVVQGPACHKDRLITGWMREHSTANGNSSEKEKPFCR